MQRNMNHASMRDRARQVVRRNNVVVMGEGAQTLLLTHGFGCDQRIWHKVIPLLSTQYRLVMFDHVGSGDSQVSAYCANKYRTLHAYAEDMLDVVAALNLDAPILIAHSGSCSIGVLAEHTRPQTFSRMVLVNPAPKYVSDSDLDAGFQPDEVQQTLQLMREDYPQWCQQMAQHAMQNSTRPELSARLQASFIQSNPQIMYNFARAILYSDFRREYAQIRCPVSLVHCQQDVVVPTSMIDYLHTTLADSEVISLAADGHFPQISHSTALVAALRDILARQNAA
ncbi:alpha/beta fold hydrolase [Aliidiomarina maris]|uniref:Alpha/beta hydrolase n=1 Tax=Aliidiomarina maris TaxID=531312 RepID=A0A327WTQ8_9GAMM|nr:alpha/beta hydrolase [Aliidiomarina maris]RAJ94642.1 sigma-B regulation protein RsbQ [Aliidiomarina maris]RUO19739.1 alpha/beta hydrolase [Aliidiomarina maris]